MPANITLITLGVADIARATAEINRSLSTGRWIGFKRRKLKGPVHP